MIPMGFLNTWNSCMGRKCVYCNIQVNMQCWKLALTETVSRNVNYSFFELVRQNMRLKLQQ